MRIKQIMELLTQGLKLPRIEVHLGTTGESRHTFKDFTRAHPKFPLFRRKTVGVELLSLGNFRSFEDYLSRHGGKNSPAYFRRRCLSQGYVARPIDPDRHREELRDINHSLSKRQGKEMNPDYIAVKDSYRLEGNWLYIGVFSPQDRLVAYLFVHSIGELAYVGPVLGHGDFLRAGIMYLIFTEAIRSLLESGSCAYFMYDMHFGASEGLRLFKSRHGFSPHRVRWLLRDRESRHDRLQKH